MKSIILVGGEGTRLRPLTYSVVKSMVPLVNRPFIEHVISRLVQHGVNDIVLAMGYRPDSIFEYFSKNAAVDLKLTYSLEEKPLGTAGAVKHASEYVDGTFFVLNGDVFSGIDYTDMLACHKRNKAVATIALTHVEDPTKFGVVESDESGRVKKFVEKPRPEEVTSHWINAGVYILEPEVLNYMPNDEFYMFERGVFPAMLEKGERIFSYASGAYWIDMGTPLKYRQLNMDILSGTCSSPLYKGGPIMIDPSSTVDPSANLTPPVLVGMGCRIGREAALKGPVILGNSCIIGDGARLENSILWDNISVGRTACITNSIIASGDNIKEKARLIGETINHNAPADAGGK